MWKVPKVRLRFYILPLIFLLISIYFMYHLIEGERGLFRLFSVNEELKNANILLKQTNAEKVCLQNRVDLLSSHALDADILDEVAREELGLIESEEFIIFD